MNNFRTPSHFPRRTLPMSLFVLMGSALVSGEEIRIQRIASRTGQGFPSAVRVANAPLVHTTQLLPAKPASDDTRSEGLRLLGELERLMAEYRSRRDDLVKLNVYVRNAEARTAFLEDLSKWSTGELPAVAFVTTPLPDPDAGVGLDAVFVSRRAMAEAIPTRDLIQKKENADWSQASVLPVGDVVYISGQAQPGELATATRKTLEELHRTLKHLGLDKKHIVQVKCFVEPMREIASVNRQIEAFFGSEAIPPVSHVEWISPSLPIEIELVAFAPPMKSAETIRYMTPPWMKSSPVFSRLARIHGTDRIYISGLYAAKKGTGAEQVRAIFAELKQVLQETDSDLEHLAKGTYYVSDDEASGELNRLRPEYYDPQRPPAASKAAVTGVGIADRTLTIDMIAAPKTISD